jgi:hypothetical protein
MLMRDATALAHFTIIHNHSNVGSERDLAGVTCALLKALAFDFNAAPGTPRHLR